MGEKTQDLSRITLPGATINVELNHPVCEGESSVVHIQTESARFECSLEDFFSLASAILVAEKNLKSIKELV
ncbi:hypothetical protein [Desulfosudis oleivorans]|uniref:hypothetical protein n=1 Tax=Desulfosudis oleivorans TaxID=181663 RepID=UPI00059C6B20|nr:hypothetical protein [Desulfosudis oleivorans]